MKLKALAAAIACITSSAHALEGTVVDSDGNAIDGATIKVVGKRLSASTDEQGKFNLEINSETELHISAPGFAHQTLHVHSDETNTDQRIVLVESVIEQVDVVGIPLHTSNIESAMPVNVLGGERLRDKQAATLGDTLANEIGVHTSFHGNVASTPVVRGLSGPRVLITQNSLDASDVSRVGPDHSVSAEASTAEQIEILRGPSTLLFGSGAIGGVVNVVDKRVPTDTETAGEWTLSRDTVNDQELASVNLNFGAGDFAFHVDGFWREADDYEVPVAPELEEEDHDHEHEEDHDEEHEDEHHDDEHGDERIVESTAEESKGFTVGASYILDNGYVGLSYGKLDREYGIPGHSHGGHEDEHDEEEEEEHEEEHHMEGEEDSVTLVLKQDRYQFLSELSFDHDLISGLNTRVGYTDYAHTEFESGMAGTTFTNETGEARFELLHQSLGGWHGAVVVDYKNSKFAAQGEEAFAPASETNAFAVGLLEEKHVGDVLIQLGARIEQVSIESDEVTISDVEFHMHDDEHDEEEHEEEHDEEHGEEVFAFSEDYAPISLSAGIVWDFAPGYNIGLSFSHSERAPSAAELLSYGPHIATDTFEVGALFEIHEEDDEIHFEPVEDVPDLETSNNIDLSFRKFEGDVGIIVNLFYNEIDNYYAQYDTELLAEVSHDHDEEEEEAEEAEEHEEDIHEDELPVFLFQSADATLYGYEAQGIWQINEHLKTTLFTDYVRAELDEGGNLPRIPPMRIGASFDYVYDRISANLSLTQYADQDDVAMLETETEGYNWVDAHINYRIPLDSTELTLFLKGENLTDEEARVHSSFLKNIAPRPGRNFRVGIRGTF